MQIIICGDLSVTEESFSNFQNMDVEGCFGDVADIFHSSDHVMVNLECVLTEEKNGIRKYGPCLKGPLNTAKTSELRKRHLTL